MSFATSCLRGSGIIRKQLVQLDNVLHPQSLTVPAQEPLLLHTGTGDLDTPR